MKTSYDKNELSASLPLPLRRPGCPKDFDTQTRRTLRIWERCGCPLATQGVSRAVRKEEKPFRRLLAGQSGDTHFRLQNARFKFSESKCPKDCAYMYGPI